jgi:hypothetical protein
MTASVSLQICTDWTSVLLRWLNVNTLLMMFDHTIIVLPAMLHLHHGSRRPEQRPQGLPGRERRIFRKLKRTPFKSNVRFLTVSRDYFVPKTTLQIKLIPFHGLNSESSFSRRRWASKSGISKIHDPHALCGVRQNTSKEVFWRIRSSGSVLWRPRRQSGNSLLYQRHWKVDKSNLGLFN